MSVLKKLTVGALASGAVKNFDLRLDNDLEKYLPLDMLLVSSTDTALNVTIRLDNSDMKAFKLVKNNSKRVKGVPFSSITIQNDGDATIVAGNLMCEVGLLPAEVEMSAMEAIDLTGNATVLVVGKDYTFYKDGLTKLTGAPADGTGTAAGAAQVLADYWAYDNQLTVLQGSFVGMEITSQLPSGGDANENNETWISSDVGDVVTLDSQDTPKVGSYNTKIVCDASGGREILWDIGGVGGVDLSSYFADYGFLMGWFKHGDASDKVVDEIFFRDTSGRDYWIFSGEAGDIYYLIWTNAWKFYCRSLLILAKDVVAGFDNTAVRYVGIDVQQQVNKTLYFDGWRLVLGSGF